MKAMSSDFWQWLMFLAVAALKNPETLLPGDDDDDTTMTTTMTMTMSPTIRVWARLPKRCYDNGAMRTTTWLPPHGSRRPGYEAEPRTIRQAMVGPTPRNPIRSALSRQPRHGTDGGIRRRRNRIDVYHYGVMLQCAAE
jgi:hypothetical protein